MKKFLPTFILMVLIFCTTFGQSKWKLHYKGYDIFFVGKYIYVVRSDIGYILRAKQLDGANTTKSKVFSLNEALANGEGYFGLNRMSDRHFKECVV